MLANPFKKGEVLSRQVVDEVTVAEDVLPFSDGRAPRIPSGHKGTAVHTVLVMGAAELFVGLTDPQRELIQAGNHVPGFLVRCHEARGQKGWCHDVVDLGGR